MAVECPQLSLPATPPLLVTVFLSLRNGLLIDHYLCEVNGQNVIGLKDKDIAKIFDESPRTVTITIMPKFIYDHLMKKLVRCVGVGVGVVCVCVWVGGCVGVLVWVCVCVGVWVCVGVGVCEWEGGCLSSHSLYLEGSST